ncbi:MAG: hypothetical protein RSE23_01705 [Clostridia bacterium]
MKKLVILIMVLLLAVPAALADTITIDLGTATLDELQAAQSTISDRISTLRAASAPVGEAVQLTGTGTAIHSGVDVPQIPARVTVTGKVKVTLTGGAYDHVFNNWQFAGSCEALTEAATYEALVEGEGDWSVSIEPLAEGGTLEMSGVGPYVSDFFPLSNATIVHGKLDASSTDGWSATLRLAMGHQYSNIAAWQEESVLGDSLFSSPLVFEGDGIVKPTVDRTQYYWIVDVPVGAEWTISVK